MGKLKKAVNIVLKECLGAKKHESILIITDKNKINIAKLFFKTAKKYSSKVNLLKKPIAKIDGEEPSKKIANQMLVHDVIIIITTRSLSHTKARIAASKKGARIVSMPNITMDIIKRSLIVSYKAMERKTRSLSNLINKAKKIRVETNKGTNIEMMKIKKPDKDCGLLFKRKSFGNLPAGEVSFGPKKCNGIFVVDASAPFLGKLKSHLKFIVKDNYVTKVSGKEANTLIRMLNKFGKSAYNLAEFSIGTNDKAKITGNILEDEKVFGTAHFALGNNLSYGGKVNVPLHLDFVFKKPTIFVDNKKIVSNGKFLFKY